VFLEINSISGSGNGDYRKKSAEFVQAFSGKERDKTVRTLQASEADVIVEIKSGLDG
jgi:hypothetical protein